MRRYFSKKGAVHATQWTGENLADIGDMLAGTGIEIFVAGETPLTGRILIGEPEFPFWLCAGEWLTRDDAGELDGWPDSNFRGTYKLAGVAVSS